MWWGQICFSAQKIEELYLGASAASDLDNLEGEIWVLQAEEIQVRSDIELMQEWGTLKNPREGKMYTAFGRPEGRLW